MRLHDIQNTHARPKSRRIGRGVGSGRGTYAGRGVKGQKARTGANSNIPRTFVGGSTALIQRLPKLKGFKSHRTRPVTVNVSRLAAVFKDGQKVTITNLIERKLINAEEASRGVKIVGASGEIKPTFTYDTESGQLRVTKKLLV